jgi:hypothetical protein
MKRENLDKAFNIDAKIRKIEELIEKFSSDLEKEIPMNHLGSEIKFSLPATKQVLEILLSDLDIQKHVLLKELEDLK